MVGALAIYIIILIVFWLATLFWLLVDDEGCYYVNAIVMGDEYTKADLNGWIKMVWISIFWPIYLIYLYLRYGFIPSIKFLWKALIFIFKFLIYPFKLAFGWIKFKKPSEPLHDKIAKWIVKKYHL